MEANAPVTTPIALDPTRRRLNCSQRRIPKADRNSTSARTARRPRRSCAICSRAPTQKIDGLEYDVAYKLAERTVGGDIVDVFHYDNGNAAFSIADISGKGTQAAVYAALVKYGMRAFVSQGLTAERVLRSLDRLFLENNAFERTELFASVFLAIFDDSRRALTYASAGHEPALISRPDGTIRVLEPTAPLVGVFDDQHHLFRQRLVELEPGTLLVVTTDGVTESRSPKGAFFGMEGLIETVRARANGPISDLPDAIVDAVAAHSNNRFHDDIGVFAVRAF